MESFSLFPSTGAEESHPIKRIGKREMQYSYSLETKEILFPLLFLSVCDFHVS